MYKNETKRRLLAGNVVLGMGVQQVRNVNVAALAVQCGFDFLFIDMEHAPLDISSVGDITAAALPLQMAGLVRVPGKQSQLISRLLDSGAQGIVVPHVDTAAEAALAVRACKYAPIGLRSFLGSQPHFGYATVPVAEAMRQANDEILVTVMLESPEAIANAEAIAAVPGIDVLMIGSNDLSMELGIAGQVDHALVQQAYRTVIDACARHGKFPGMGGVGDAALIRHYIEMGMRFILSANDTELLIAGGQARVAALR
ncbi:MAG: hpcH/HpaI aldolase/citrate lyase family protein [Rhodoferax sp.]|nr:hpcH/HpaI aldolase/citrate lyase family protein [Rhodoferax sp.]